MVIRSIFNTIFTVFMLTECICIEIKRRLQSCWMIVDDVDGCGYSKQ